MLETYFGIPWSYAGIGVLQTLPFVVYVYFCTRLLDIPRIKLFVVGEIVLALIVSPFHFVIPTGIPRVLIGLLLYDVLPLLLSCGRLSRRLIVLALMYVVLALGEFPVALTWFALSGGQPIGYEQLLAQVDVVIVADIVYGLSLGLMLWGVEGLVRRFMSKGNKAEDETGEPEYSIRKHPFVLCALLELALVFIFMAIVYDVGNWDLGNLCLGAFLCALSLAAAVVVYVAYVRFVEKRRSDVRARLLQEQVEAYSESFRPIYQRIVATSRLRHDTRNHVQVARFLIEAGRFDEAARYLSEFQSELDKIAADSEQLCG